MLVVLAIVWLLSLGGLMFSATEGKAAAISATLLVVATLLLPVAYVLDSAVN